MSWDLDAMSVLPEEWQDEIIENFSPEFLAERLSDYITTLLDRIEELENDIQEYVESQPPI